VTTKENQYK